MQYGEGPLLEDHLVERLIRAVPFFRALNRLDLARLVGALAPVDFPADSIIFREGEAADALYLLDSGRVEVSLSTAAGDRALTEVEAPAHFGELGLLLGRRTGSVRAVTDVRVWRLPRDRFERLVQERPTLGLTVARGLAELVDQRSRQGAGASAAPRLPFVLTHDASVPGKSPRHWMAVIISAVGLPLVLWTVAPPAGLSAQGWHVGLIMLGSALLWLSELIPYYLIALAMGAAWGIAGLVPVSLAFSGFSSPSYLLALAVLGLAAAMARTGLLFRIALLLLRVFPRTYGGQVLSLLTGGLLLTPLMPIATARVTIIAPVAQELAEALGYPLRSRGRAGLAFAGIIGYGTFGCIFLTGLVANFFIVALLPEPDRIRFDWLTWLVSAAPAGAVLLLGSSLLLLVWFRSKATGGVTLEVLQRQQRTLGPLSRHEWVTILGLAVMLGGLLVGPALHVSTAGLGLSALILVIAGGALGPEGFRGGIEWGYLVFFGVLLGAGDVLRAVGIDRWIGHALLPVARAIPDPGVLVLLLAGGVIACRLVLPQIPAMYLLSLALVPAAHGIGVSPWVVGFVVQLTAYTWIHPRQSDYYRLTRDLTRHEMFTDRHGVAVGVGVTILTLIGIVASLPFWRAQGLLGP
ncbi:MAG TPA: SLC13 family permease [bacterium]|nr:SLC13 family permease [bacterium]